MKLKDKLALIADDVLLCIAIVCTIIVIFAYETIYGRIAGVLATFCVTTTDLHIFFDNMKRKKIFWRRRIVNWNWMTVYESVEKYEKAAKEKSELPTT